MGTLRGGSEKAPSPLDSRTASRLQLRLARRIAVAGDDGVDGQQGACRSPPRRGEARPRRREACTLTCRWLGGWCDRVAAARPHTDCSCGVHEPEDAVDFPGTRLPRVGGEGIAH